MYITQEHRLKIKQIASTDIDQYACPDLVAAGFEVLGFCRDWWYTAGAFRKNNRNLLLITRTLRGGVSALVDPEDDLVLELITAPDPEEHNGILGNLRNEGFKQWSYQDGKKLVDWLVEKGY